MRKPEAVERLYLDFDSFFASVMQQAMPALRGRPVGVVPFGVENAQHTVVIACSKEAKAQGCQNIMRVPEALKLCPDLVLVEQRPDLYRRAHHKLINEIAQILPIETIKSIDELVCVMDSRSAATPYDIAAQIKAQLAENVGPHIKCSIGMAANRLLSKMACKAGKPDGATLWRPIDMPAPLTPLPLSDLPGVGKRMQARLQDAGIWTMQDILKTQPKQLRALWRNVNGERMWYALHGYEVYAEPTSRGMYGHARVLPPKWRDFSRAKDSVRLLLTKAARRMRRDGFYANMLSLWFSAKEQSWWHQRDLPNVQDDQACLSALEILWQKALSELPPHFRPVRVGVTLMDLTPNDGRQLDIFLNDDAERQSWERITSTIDGLNNKYGKRVVTIGHWSPPPGGYAGGKIAFTRIPSAEDFW